VCEGGGEERGEGGGEEKKGRKEKGGLDKQKGEDKISFFFLSSLLLTK
jgi:hypothetical protein